MLGGENVLAPARAAQSQVAAVPTSIAETAKLAKSLVLVGAMVPKAPIWIPIHKTGIPYRWMKSWQTRKEQRRANQHFCWREHSHPFH
jgi:hypothetical protein